MATLKVNHDQLNLNYDSCSLKLASNQAISDDNLNAISWDTDIYDDSDMHSTTTNPSRITVRKTGIYLITGKMEIDATTPTYYEIAIYKNGSVIGNHSTKDYKIVTKKAMTFCTIQRLYVNDYISIYGRCSGGSSRNFIGESCFVQMSKVGK